ncbi:1332_t:CDS:2, partial [Gigaspora rosea]
MAPRKMHFTRNKARAIPVSSKKPTSVKIRAQNAITLASSLENKQCIQKSMNDQDQIAEPSVGAIDEPHLVENDNHKEAMVNDSNTSEESTFRRASRTVDKTSHVTALTLTLPRYTNKINDSNTSEESTFERTSHTIVNDSNTSEEPTFGQASHTIDDDLASKASYMTTIASTLPRSTNEVNDSNTSEKSAFKRAHTTMTSPISIAEDLASKISHTSHVTTVAPTALQGSTNKDNEINFESYNSFLMTNVRLCDTSNEFKAALWVAQHPRVLDLAIRIQGAMSDPNMPALIRDVENWFDTYRYKLHLSILNLACQFSNIYEWQDEPLMHDLNIFINGDIWRQTLQLHLKSTDMPALKRDLEMYKLFGVFVRQAIKE